MNKKLLIPVAVVAVGFGAWVWWLQGGLGGPVSDAAARRYFNRIVAAARAKDFKALCRLNGSERVCQEELRVYCPEGFGSGPAPLFPRGEDLERECRGSVPHDPPTVVSSRHRPSRDGSVGGRVLVVRGVDGRNEPYETDVLIFRDKRSYKAIHAVFWSGDKFEDLQTTSDGQVASRGSHQPEGVDGRGRSPSPALRPGNLVTPSARSFLPTFSCYGRRTSVSTRCSRVVLRAVGDAPLTQRGKMARSTGHAS